jgi:hypothetical protein
MAFLPSGVTPAFLPIGDYSLLRFGFGLFRFGTQHLAQELVGQDYSSLPCIRHDEGFTMRMSSRSSKMPRPSRRAFRFRTPILSILQMTMTQEQANTFFYLFSQGKGPGIDIIELPPVEALEMWKRGRHWLDMPQKTLSDAEKLRVQLLATGQR